MSQPSSFGPMPLSLSGLLYKAMSTMTAYDQQMMQQWLKFMKESAAAYGGWNAEGKLQTNSDGKATGGLVGRFLEISYDAANAAGDSIKDEAIGYAISGGTGLAIGLGGTAAAAYGTREGELGDQLKDAKAMQQELNTRPANNEFELQTYKKAGGIEEDSEEIELERQIQNRIKDWASGDKSKLAHFTDPTNKAFNEKVANHAKTHPEFDKICKNVDDLIKDLEGKIQGLSTKFNTASNTLNQGTNAASGIGQSATTFQKATDQQSSQEEAAQAEVVKELQPQWTSNINNAQQNANQFQQDAAANAAAFGQITQTRA